MSISSIGPSAAYQPPPSPPAKPSSEATEAPDSKVRDGDSDDTASASPPPPVATNSGKTVDIKV